MSDGVALLRFLNKVSAVACQALILLGAVHATAAPQRIVSTHLCTDEYVFRLVPRERIAALSWLAGDTNPVVSTIAGQVKGITLTRASTEEVLTLSPDLVVLYEGTNPRLRRHLVETHVPFVEIAWANSLGDIRQVTRKLGAALDARARAAALLRDMDDNLAAAKAIVASRPVKALVYEPNGYATGGGVTDQILDAAGLDDIAPGMDSTRSGTIPVEMVVARPPALLILNGENGRLASRADLVLDHPALATLNRTTYIAHMRLVPLLCPGPWSAEVAPALARLGRAAEARSRNRGGANGS